MGSNTYSYKDWTFRALTDIWTGDWKRQGDGLVPTGLVGSIRWWYEVLVRGLGGAACDPTGSDANHTGQKGERSVRCPEDRKKATEPGHHCVVCELFGCTGWARKFRVMVLDNDGNVIQDQIKTNQTFTLRFVPLRPIREEEWCLLDCTLRLIAEYGAIGGRTVLKPSDEWGLADLGANDFRDLTNKVIVIQSRRWLPLQTNDEVKEVDGEQIRSLQDLQRVLSGEQHGKPVVVTVLRGGVQETLTVWVGKRHHQDFGLISYERGPSDPPCAFELEHLKKYVARDHWRHNFKDQDFSWASLQNFWCVKGRYLARKDAAHSTFNLVVGRKEPKNVGKDLERDDNMNRWLAGRQQESKKVFSFKHPQEVGRTFGFIKPGTVEFGDIKRRLKQAWPNLQENEFLTGDRILRSVCGGTRP